MSANAARISKHLERRKRWSLVEITFWFVVAAAIFLLPSRDALINEILVSGLFALSLDLILGLAGVVSLGHAAFFGVGAYTAAILTNAGFKDPILLLPVAAFIAGLLGLVTAPLLLRGSDLTRLMVTMGIALMLGQVFNLDDLRSITGGSDGLEAVTAPVFGMYAIGFTGQRNAALYSFVVLFILFVVARRVRQSPFGLSITAVRENRVRAGALGIATQMRLVAMYTLSAAYAGIAGALLAETTQIASLDLFDFHRSADVMLMLIIGGAGYLYGGLIGAAVFIVLRDVISAATPEYWEFWIGLLLVVLVLSGRDKLGALAARVRRTVLPNSVRQGGAA
jgi:branched-chain amino acid transport system permease protein